MPRRRRPVARPGLCGGRARAAQELQAQQPPPPRFPERASWREHTDRARAGRRRREDGLHARARVFQCLRFALTSTSLRLAVVDCDDPLPMCATTVSCTSRLPLAVNSFSALADSLIVSVAEPPAGIEKLLVPATTLCFF